MTREEMIAAVQHAIQGGTAPEHIRNLRDVLHELEAGWRPIDDAARNSDEEWLLGTTESDFMVVAFWDDTKDDFQWQTADGPGYRAGAFTHYRPKPRPPTTSDGGEG